MKTVRITTTEFYKNPSKAINIVKDDGVVYLVYKNLKDPIAVIEKYKEEKVSAETELENLGIKEKRMEILRKIWKENKGKTSEWKSGLDLQNAVRQ